MNIIDELEERSGIKGVSKDRKINHLFVNRNKVVSTNLTDEVEARVDEKDDGIELYLTIKKSIEKPVFVCFGILDNEFEQKVRMKLKIEKRVKAKVMSYCIFPKDIKVVHSMDADIVIEEGAEYEYIETHVHGEKGDITINAIARIEVKKGAVYNNDFSILKGKAGKVLFDYMTRSHEYSTSKLKTRIKASDNDEIKIVEKTDLVGEHSSTILDSRIVLDGRSKGYVENEINGIGKYSRGHMECVEIINGDGAEARAVPIVNVSDKTSKITHEAAIGSIDRKEILLLMSRGLTQREAIDIIIRGLLK